MTDISESEIKDFRLPAEWEPQSAVLLTWPHEKGDWGVCYTRVESVFIALTQAITRTQTVIIGVLDAPHQAAIQTKLNQHNVPLAQVIFYLAPSNDVWARDHGPITVINQHKQPVLLDFKFNAWGDKYASQLDDQIPARFFQADSLADILKDFAYEKIDFVLEGGSIESDGEGTLLTTSACLLNPQRNRLLSQKQITEKLQAYLGCDRVLWLDHGQLNGDDTDAHIDTLARFLNPQTIAYVACDNPQDPHYAALAKMADNLSAFRDAKGQPYTLVPLPLPSPIFDQQGQQLPATYANFLITNHQVLVPIYQDPLDVPVLALFKQHFPEREIVGVDCRVVIEQFGSLHCLTMQIPKNSQESRG